MKKILIVEDEEPIRRVLKRILADENPEFKISEAIDGNEAIEKLTKDKFDLVVCDIKMPKKDGLDVLKFTNKKGIISPFIMLTGHGNIETAVNSIKKGAYDFIEKPFDSDLLIFKVKKALENFKLKKKIQQIGKKSYVSQIVTNSEAMKKISESLKKISKTLDVVEYSQAF